MGSRHLSAYSPSDCQCMPLGMGTSHLWGFRPSSPDFVCVPIMEKSGTRGSEGEVGCVSVSGAASQLNRDMLSWGGHRIIGP